MAKSLLEKLQEPIPVDGNMPDFSNDPFVLAKLEKAEKLIAKYGLPESFRNKTSDPDKKGKDVKPNPKAKDVKKPNR
jgi:hypothetical protein